MSHTIAACEVAVPVLANPGAQRTWKRSTRPITRDFRGLPGRRSLGRLALWTVLPWSMKRRGPILASLSLAFAAGALVMAPPARNALAPSFVPSGSSEEPRPTDPNPGWIDSRIAPPLFGYEATSGDAPVDATVAAVAHTPPSPKAAAPSSLCPDEMVYVQGSHCFYLEQDCARWEDPEGQPAQRVCAQFEKPSRCISARRNMRFCIDRDEFVARGEQLPAHYVSYWQADVVCGSLGKRLCTSMEWEFACEGEEGLPYPYGYERSAVLCNQDRMMQDGKNNANADMREAPHITCVSPFGVRDMVGNVDEWVRQPNAKPPRRSELRGGWWMTGRNRCRANTSRHDEKYAGIQTGFRCCKDAAPDREVRTARSTPTHSTPAR